MKHLCRSPARIFFLTLTGLVIGCAAMRPLELQTRRSVAQSTIANWPEFSRLLAARMIDEYGPPDQVDARRLRWVGKDPWRRITIWKTRPDSRSDSLEETVAYPVPPDKVLALERFSRRLRVSENRTELSARSDSQEINRLTLNLAVLVVEGLDPVAARDAYANTLRLREAGKSSALIAGLLFQPTPKPSVLWPIRLSLSPGTLSRNPLWSNEPASEAHP
jgi:hypothetical protein